MRKMNRWMAVLLILAMALTLAACGGEEVPEGKDVSLGKVENGVYENTYLNVRFAADGWEMLGAEDLEDGLDGITELLEGTEVEEALEGRTQVMSMQAMAADGTNVNIIYTKMSTVERLANLALSEEEAMDAVLDQKDTLIASYEAGGITVDSMEKKHVTYAGEDRVGTLTTGSVQGIPCFILQVYEQTLGSYSVVITMTSFQENTTENIAEMFEKLNP